MVYQELNKYDFRKAFADSGCKNTFSYEALNALYDFYNKLEEDYELDVIEISCDWTEYSSFDEAVRDYGKNFQKETTVIKLEQGGYLVMDF